MDLVALPGKNNRISDVSDPNWARFGKKRPILELRGDFQGCSCKSGRDQGCSLGYLWTTFPVAGDIICH